MKAVVFHQHGGPEVLQYIDVPDPVHGPNDAIVRVQAAAANYNDIWARVGVPGVKTIFPHISGSDVAGDVVAIGSEVKGVAVGDAVIVHPGLSCGHCRACSSGQNLFCRQFKIWGFQTGPYDGGHSEYIRIPAANLVPKPPNLSYVDAASLPLVLETVWRMLVTRVSLKPGQTVMIWGGAGGLGTLAIQVARIFGAIPIAIVSDEAKRATCIELGAELVINRKTQSVVDEVMAFTKKRGVDVVFEHTGESTWETSVRCMSYTASLVVCGATSGFNGKTDIRFLWNKQMNFLGSHLGTKAELMDALVHVEKGAIKPSVGKVLPLSAVGAGQQLMESGDSIGKVVYVPDSLTNGGV